MNQQRSKINKALSFAVAVSLFIGIVYVLTNRSLDSQGIQPAKENPVAAKATPVSDVGLTAAEGVALTEAESVIFDNAHELFSDAFGDVPATTINWADNFYNNSDAKITAERYRFVRIDYEMLHRQLKQSPAYLAAIVGRSPPPVSTDSVPSFSLTLFNDRRIDLLIANVRMLGEPGEQYFTIRGEVIGGGSFKLSTTEGQNTLSGQIDTQDWHTRIDTLSDSSVTSVAEFSRHRMESANIVID